MGLVRMMMENMVVKHSLEITVCDQHSCIIFTLMHSLWWFLVAMHIFVKLVTQIDECSSIGHTLDIKVRWITNVAHCHNAGGTYRERQHWIDKL